MFVGISAVASLGFGRRKSLFSLLVPRNKQCLVLFPCRQQSFSVAFICFPFPVWWQMLEEENRGLSLRLPTKLQ